jgi:Arc/MetJ-type ribon-helix-helix transcriptional regulator
MTAKFKRIHMPKPLYEEIEKFVAKQDSPYKTVSELCREAGRMLTDHYRLRDNYA